MQKTAGCALPSLDAAIMPRNGLYPWRGVMR
jgi:hypothetical protein